MFVLCFFVSISSVPQTTQKFYSVFDSVGLDGSYF